MSMLAQSTIEDEPRAAFVGLIADSGPVRVKSGVSAARKVASLAVVAQASTLYTVTINGTPFEFTSGVGATTAAIVAGLVTAINAGSEPVLASGADTPLIITSTIDGPAGDFELTTGGPLTPSVTTPAGGVLPFGHFVCMDETNPYDRAVRLPSSAADITGGRGLGIVCTDNYTRQSDGTPVESVPGFSMANVLEVGKIWVEVDGPVAKGDDAFVRYDSAGRGPGSITGSAGGAAELTHGVFDSGSRWIDGKQLAILYINR